MNEFICCGSGAARKRLIHFGGWRAGATALEARTCGRHIIHLTSVDAPMSPSARESRAEFDSTMNNQPLSKSADLSFSFTEWGLSQFGNASRSFSETAEPLKVRTKSLATEIAGIDRALASERERERAKDAPGPSKKKY